MKTTTVPALTPLAEWMAFNASGIAAHHNCEVCSRPVCINPFCDCPRDEGKQITGLDAAMCVGDCVAKWIAESR